MEKVVTTNEKLLQNFCFEISKKHEEEEDEKDYIEYDDDDWGNDF